MLNHSAMYHIIYRLPLYVTRIKADGRTDLNSENSAHNHNLLLKPVFGIRRQGCSDAGLTEQNKHVTYTIGFKHIVSLSRHAQKVHACVICIKLYITQFKILLYEPVRN